LTLSRLSKILIISLFEGMSVYQTTTLIHLILDAIHIVASAIAHLPFLNISLENLFTHTGISD
ncbi:hypothetical protein L9F63_021267, partial [Diploptera punctata]